MANALTTFRLLLAYPFTLCMIAPDTRHAMWAALIFLAAVVSDLFDGAIARWLGSASTAGRLFDHTADVLFVMGGLTAGAARGVFPWALPAVVAIAFSQYVIDSYVTDRARGLRPSWLGRYNGIFYFVPLAVDIAVRLGAARLGPILIVIAWLLVASTLLSMGERLQTTLAAPPRRANVSPAGERRGRRPR